MRLFLLLSILLAAAACSPEALLCSDDPACEPAGCGPNGCIGGGQLGGGGGGGGGAGEGGGGSGGAGGSVEVPPVCRAMCEHIYQLCGTILEDENQATLSFDECFEVCAAGSPSPAEAACVVESACFTWDACFQAAG